MDANPSAKYALQRLLQFKESHDIPKLPDGIDNWHDYKQFGNYPVIHYLHRVLRRLDNVWKRYETYDPARFLYADGDAPPPGFTLPVFPNPVSRADMKNAIILLLHRIASVRQKSEIFKRKAKRAERALMLQAVLDERVNKHTTPDAIGRMFDAAAQAGSALPASYPVRKHVERYGKQAEDELKRLQTHLDVLGAVSSALAAWTPDQPLPALLNDPSVQALLDPEHDIHTPISGLSGLVVPVVPQQADMLRDMEDSLARLAAGAPPPPPPPPPPPAHFAAAARHDDDDDSEDGAPQGPMKRRRR